MKNTERFSSRVADYVKYRPYYPPEVLEFLQVRCEIQPGSLVGDIGSGTGNLSRLFLDAGYDVVGVEPNKEMREAGETLLESFSGFSSVDGTAERTTLPDASVDLVTAGQAFHWFEPALARLEFQRILKSGRWCALIWNDRIVDANRFHREYELILRKYVPDYLLSTHKEISDRILADFFAPSAMTQFQTPNEQVMDLGGFLGRVLSSSYVPQAGRPGHEEMIEALTKLFDEENDAGHVSFLYSTQLFCACLTA